MGGEINPARTPLRLSDTGRPVITSDIWQVGRDLVLPRKFPSFLGPQDATLYRRHLL